MMYIKDMVIFLFVFVSQHTDVKAALTHKECSHDMCPPWFLHNETTCECQCGDQLEGIIKCNDNKYAQEIGVLDCNCMTTDQELGTVAGACFYNCERHPNAPHKYDRDELYHSLPLNVSHLNEDMCEKKLRRTGRLCGKCMDGYHLSAYSYDMKCIKCSKSTVHSWITYVCMAFIPLTMFFVFVLVLRINITSPKLMSYVLLTQTLATPTNARIVLTALEDYPDFFLVSKLVLAMYGIWNLDFFRTFSPPMCLGIDELQVLALDYAIAVYPLFLVVLTYLLIQLHARGCLLLNILWFPFRKCYNHLERQVDAKTSIIDIFASFLVLSYVKFLCVSFDLLVPTRVYNIHGEQVGIYLYYNANVAYFGPKHLPYGILAVLVTLIFGFIPLLLLLLYPLRCFQKLFGNWQTLRIFVDSFQGSYKDGVAEGRYDCRYFSAAFFITRILLIVTYALTLSGYYYAISVILYMILILIMVVIKPYRSVLSYYLTLDVLHISLLALWHASAVSIMVASVKAPKGLPFSVLLSGSIGAVPAFYIPILFLKQLLASRFIKKLFSLVSHSRRRAGSQMLPDIGDVVMEREGKNSHDWMSPHSAASQNYGSINTK